MAVSAECLKQQWFYNDIFCIKNVLFTFSELPSESLIYYKEMHSSIGHNLILAHDIQHNDTQHNNI